MSTAFNTLGYTDGSTEYDFVCSVDVNCFSECSISSMRRFSLCGLNSLSLSPSLSFFVSVTLVVASKFNNKRWKNEYFQDKNINGAVLAFISSSREETN